MNLAVWRTSKIPKLDELNVGYIVVESRSLLTSPYGVVRTNVVNRIAIMG